ncbi:LysR family transcriptional regulator [Slackia heliotrinireducens]|uniref:LysR family transcriptional regulator n=1 Tax=Slackia heliotrinireducens TaxID=84110 RepID=UPI00331626F4
MSMNLSQLYYFRKLAELQHYTKAAKELYITQPALSDAIKSLEKELGVPLFQRKGRNVCLTKYGKEFAVYVNDALRELDKGIAVMKEYTGSLSGRINIGGIYTITGDYLPALLRSYHAEYGDAVKFVVSQGVTLELIEDLKNDKYDVVFSAFKDNEPTLRFFPVVAHQLVACVKADHPLAERKSIRLDDLRKCGFEIYTYRTDIPIGAEVAAVTDEYGIKTHQRFDDEITLCGMVSNERDDSVGLLTYTIGMKPFTDLVIIPIDDRDVPVDFHRMYMVYKKDEFKNRALESFIDLAKEFVPPEGTLPTCKVVRENAE